MTALQYVPLLLLLFTVLSSLAAVVWKLSGIGTKVDLILTNHLPHINADIQETRQGLRDLHAEVLNLYRE